MKVHLNQIPDEGLHLEGEETRDILELPPAENIKLLAPVRYSLDVGISGGGLWAAGEVSADLEMQCVRCLEHFPHTVHVPDVALQVELPSTETVDLTPHLREDILLALPDYPRCDSSGERVCPGPRKVAAAQTDEDAAGRPPSAWETLDQINIQSN
jgi:uncharacterized protein